MPGLYRSGNWNEKNLNPLSSINWRASLVPAAVVIPASIAYIKVVAVKKLVVRFLAGASGLAPFKVSAEKKSQYQWMLILQLCRKK
ncbi:hypothetical protein ACHAW6_000135 [Cyclotella cf. meneghiniana]